MNYNVYAIVDDDGYVEDLRIFDTKADASAYVDSIYANGKAILANDYKIKLRDIYADGRFYRQDGDEQIIIDPTYNFDAVKLENMDTVVS